MWDWGAVTAVGTVIGVGIMIAGGLIAYGALSRRVNELGEREEKQEKRMDRMEAAIEKATSVGNQVELLKQSTEASHTLLRTEQQATTSLLVQKLDAVSGEVRSFMQGQASAGLAPRSTRAKAG